MLKAVVMDDFLTTKQAAEILGIEASRVRQLVLEGKLPARKVGRDLLIKVAALELVRNRPKVGRPATKKRTVSRKRGARRT